MLMVIHLGAYGTQCKQQQSLLQKNVSKIKKRGVIPITTTHTRRHITEQLDIARTGAKADAAEARSHISRILNVISENQRDKARVIMSDEAIFGPLLGRNGEFLLFPDINARLEILLEAMPSGQEYVFALCVRDYIDAARETFVTHPDDFDGADDFRGEPGSGWADVAGAIVKLAGPGRLVVWEYEAIRKNSPTLDEIFFADPEIKVFGDDFAKAPPFSRKATQMMRRLEGALTDQERWRMSLSVGRFYLDRDEDRPTPADASPEALLRRRYPSDLAIIRSLGCMHGAAAATARA